MIICSKIYDASRFSWDAKVPAAELSDLGVRAGVDPFCRIYDDACDVGIGLRNPKTGKVIRFAVASTDKDREGDVGGWNLEIIPEDVKHAPSLKGRRILLIND